MSSTKLKTVDPFKVATASTAATKGKKGEQLPEVTISEKLKTQLRKFSMFTERKKKDEAEATTARADVMTWAKQEFVKRTLRGEVGNFLITNGKQVVQFVVQARGKSFGEAEKKTLTETFGHDASSLLEPSDEVQLNVDVWKVHQKILTNALNHVDDDGNRLVPEDVLRALFYREMKVKPNVIQEAVHITKDEDTLAKLLFEDLKLTCSLTPK